MGISSTYRDAGDTGEKGTCGDLHVHVLVRGNQQGDGGVGTLGEVEVLDRTA